MAEPLIRVYADTSVYGGVFDDDFARASKVFFQQVRQGRLLLAVSEVVEQELMQAPQAVRDLFAEFEAAGEFVEVTEDAFALRDAYISTGIVSRKALADALHVAVASVARCPILVSWNCRHIVHFDKIPRYNAVNVARGFSPLAIHTPLEVIRYENEEEV